MNYKDNMSNMTPEQIEKEYEALKRDLTSTIDFKNQCNGDSSCYKKYSEVEREIKDKINIILNIQKGT